MVPVVRSWFYTNELQRLMPDGVEAAAVHINMGKAVGLGIKRGSDTASVKILRRILRKDPEREVRRAAEFLLSALETRRDPRTREPITD